MSWIQFEPNMNKIKLNEKISHFRWLNALNLFKIEAVANLQPFNQTFSLEILKFRISSLESQIRKLGLSKDNKTDRSWNGRAAQPSEAKQLKEHCCFLINAPWQ